MIEVQAQNLIESLTAEEFQKMVKSILDGLGFFNALTWDNDLVSTAYRSTITRVSADKLFRTEEQWLIVFARGDTLNRKLEKSLLSLATKAGADTLMTVIFRDITPRVIDSHFIQATKYKQNAILLTGDLAIYLARDYAAQYFSTLKQSAFSYANVRERMRSQTQSASWRDRFQPLKALPNRVAAGSVDSMLEDADIFRATHRSYSYLLLGNPGAGKTTSLQILAESLAETGGRTPILIPLNMYTGYRDNLLSLIGTMLGEENNPISPKFVQDLLESGAMIIMLDGMNEVHPDRLLRSLTNEVNTLTHPDARGSRSQWIVSYRKYDYTHAKLPLEHLEKNTWELLPLTADLIYKYFADELGDANGKKVYDSLKDTIRELCSTPLLLNMVLTVYHEHSEQLPSSLGALYREFIDLLLSWGNDRAVADRTRERVAAAMGLPSLTAEQYREQSLEALAALAQAMSSTAIPWEEAKRAIAGTLREIPSLERAVANLLEDLISRGILRRSRSSIAFFHHTFQEYFQAFTLRNWAIEHIIPPSGVEGMHREAVVFLVGMLSKPEPLVRRAIAVDLDLAYEMVRNIQDSTDRNIVLEVFRALYTRVMKSSLGWVTSNYRSALAAMNLAKQLNVEFEDLVRTNIQFTSEEDFMISLLRFYQELRDVSAQNSLIMHLESSAHTDSRSLTFQLAIFASQQGEYSKAISIYDGILALDPDNVPSLVNRGQAYAATNNDEAAKKDFETALELDPANAVLLTSYARLLRRLGEIDNTEQLLEKAIASNSGFPDAHYELAQMKHEEQLESAILHLEQATHLARTPEDLRRPTPLLAASYEKAENYANAIRALYRLIELEPTSDQNSARKQKIAELRLRQDQKDKQKSVREQILARDDIQLYVIAETFLKAAGFEIDHATSRWLIGKFTKPGLFSTLPVALLDVPQINGDTIRDALQALPADGADAANILLFTDAETLDVSARMQIAAYQPTQNIALITTVEAQEVLLEGDRECYSLIQRALQRVAEKDPFKLTTVVDASSDFYGRTSELHSMLDHIQHGKPFALYGIHKIGKSSILRKIQQRIAVHFREVTAVSVELSSSLKGGTDLYKLIIGQLIPDAYDNRIVTAEHFRRIMKDFHERQLRKYSSHRILVILDEYPYMIPDSFGKHGLYDYIEVLGLFKAMLQEGWFTILPCGRSSALTRTVQWNAGENPFVGIMQEQFLGPLSYSETQELLVTLGKRVGIEFDDDALKHIYGLASGHPLFTRTIASWILRQIKHGCAHEVDAEAAAQAYLADRGDRTLLRAISENNLDDEERRILRTLALQPGLHPANSLVPSGYSEFERRRLRQLLDNLRDTTVILQENRDGRLYVGHRYEILRRAIQLDMNELDF